MGSCSEDDDDDEPHIRSGGLGLSSLGLGVNGPDSVGALGPSDISVQSISTDSKTTHDDSDQVSRMSSRNRIAISIGYSIYWHQFSVPKILGFNGW